MDSSRKNRRRSNHSCVRTCTRSASRHSVFLDHGTGRLSFHSFVPVLPGLLSAAAAGDSVGGAAAAAAALATSWPSVHSACPRKNLRGRPELTHVAYHHAHSGAAHSDDSESKDMRQPRKCARLKRACSPASMSSACNPAWFMPWQSSSGRREYCLAPLTPTQTPASTRTRPFATQPPRNEPPEPKALTAEEARK